MRCGEWQRVISIPTAARQPRRDTWWKTSGRISSEDFLVVAYNIRLTEIIVALARQQIAFDPSVTLGINQYGMGSQACNQNL